MRPIAHLHTGKKSSFTNTINPTVKNMHHSYVYVHQLSHKDSEIENNYDGHINTKISKNRKICVFIKIKETCHICKLYNLLRNINNKERYCTDPHYYLNNNIWNIQRYRTISSYLCMHYAYKYSQ